MPFFAIEQIENSWVGFAEASVRVDHVAGTTITPVPYLEAWYVSDEFRGQGIGRALVDFVEQRAIRQGYSELASDSEIDNETSIRLHKMLGFREVDRTVQFVKSLKQCS